VAVVVVVRSKQAAVALALWSELALVQLALELMLVPAAVKAMMLLVVARSLRELEQVNSPREHLTQAQGVRTPVPLRVC
jgi:hypothetical protein